jgi:hypothetical protein
MSKIYIELQGDNKKPHATVKRQIGRFNFGLYCTKCAEFFAVAVVTPKDEAKMQNIEFKSAGAPLFQCPFCHHQQRRAVSEIALLRLHERNKKRPPPPPDAH